MRTAFALRTACVTGLTLALSLGGCPTDGAGGGINGEALGLGGTIGDVITTTFGDADPNGLFGDPNDINFDPNDLPFDPNEFDIFGAPGGSGEDAIQDPNLVDNGGIEPGDPTPPPSEQEFSLAPDDHPDGTDLTDLGEHITLSTTLSDNEPVELFFVSASDDNQGLAPSGDRVFGHANVPYFNDNRRLRVDFDSPARIVSIEFAGGTLNGTEIGRLQAFDHTGTLLAEYVTAPLGPGETERMQIERPQADIDYMMAYVADGDGNFGRMDDLRYTLIR